MSVGQEQLRQALALTALVKCIMVINITNSGQLTISLTGDIVLATGTDAICYNYTLPAPFAHRPGVALGIKFK